MKKILLLLCIIVSLMPKAFAQKFGYIDSEYILKHMPEYEGAKKQLENLTKQWQKDIDEKYEEVNALYKAYENEYLLLTAPMRSKREEEIVKKEKEAQELQKEKFGFEGQLFNQRKALMKPIQDKIYKAVEKVAEEGMYAIIFDKTNDLIMLYSNPRFDRSAEVLKNMGLTPGEMPK